MLHRPCHGVIAAPYLPMHHDGEIDWAGLERYMEWFAAQNPAGIAMNMDASEVIALAEEEQVQVIRVCLDVLRGRIPFLSGIVSGSTRSAAIKAERYARMGVQGFAVFPPFPTFSGTPVPSEMIYRYHKAIADAAHLPIICFQFPKGWGPDYSQDILRRVAEIAEVVAIKEASFDVAQTLSTLEAAATLPQPIGVLTGSDTFIFEAMMMGCTGALIGFAGCFTRELVKMHSDVQGDDIAKARAIWRQLGPIARYCWRAPIRDFRPRMKEVLRLQGLIQSAAVREPQLGIDDAERAHIRRLMIDNGLLP